MANSWKGGAAKVVFNTGGDGAGWGHREGLEPKRTDIEFVSGGTTCRGWHYRAEGDGPRPCIVMAHGLSAVKEMGLDRYAERYAEAGYDVVVFDYRNFGASDGEPRQLIDIPGQLDDYRAAIAFARGLPDVDGRIVLWGSSLSGGHVMALAGSEPDIAAVISQGPHTDAIASSFAGGLGHGLRLGMHALWDVAGSVLGRAPHRIPAVGSPGDLALMNAPEAVEYLDLVPEGQVFEGDVPARFLLGFSTYSPGRRLRHAKAPALVQVALRDRTTPPKAAIAAAKAAPTATLKTYDTGHFALYVGETFEQFVADQLAFLKAHLT